MILRYQPDETLFRTNAHLVPGQAHKSCKLKGHAAYRGLINYLASICLHHVNMLAFLADPFYFFVLNIDWHYIIFLNYSFYSFTVDNERTKDLNQQYITFFCFRMNPASPTPARELSYFEFNISRRWCRRPINIG